MAILGIEDQKPQISSERKLEIKQLINELEVGKAARVKIECLISQYRTSFYYYLGKFNEKLEEDKKRTFRIEKDDADYLITRLS